MEMIDDAFSFAAGGKAAAQAYWNAKRALCDAWREVFDEELEARGVRGKEAFEDAVSNAKIQLRAKVAGETKLRSVLDVEPGDDLGEALLTSADLDDLPPNIIKESMRRHIEACVDDGNLRPSVRTVLRSTLSELFSEEEVRRPNVGANRHWPRLLQYLRELEFETDYSPDGRGVRIANIGGRGPVAQSTPDPSRLSLIIEPAFL